MIKLRAKDGTSLDVEDETSFIEICDTEGNPALVFYMPGPNAVSAIEGNSPEGELYAKKYDINFSKIIELGDRYKDV